MVKKIRKDNKSYWQCEACGFYYSDSSTAERCEEWCRAHNSCNLEITKKAAGAIPIS
ncbi:MAG: hypothetical protein QW559_03550 [Candidatus Woesearchaeota archaeon]